MIKYYVVIEIGEQYEDNSWPIAVFHDMETAENTMSAIFYDKLRNSPERFSGLLHGEMPRSKQKQYAEDFSEVEVETKFYKRSMFFAFQGVQSQILAWDNDRIDLWFSYFSSQKPYKYAYAIDEIDMDEFFTSHDLKV